MQNIQVYQRRLDAPGLDEQADRVIRQLLAEEEATLLAHGNECKPGDPAPATGSYQELNPFGTPTGAVQHVAEGAPLPRAPRGFSWRHVAAQDVQGS